MELGVVLEEPLAMGNVIFGFVMYYKWALLGLEKCLDNGIRELGISMVFLLSLI